MKDFIPNPPNNLGTWITRAAEYVQCARLGLAKLELVLGELGGRDLDSEGLAPLERLKLKEVSLYAHSCQVLACLAVEAFLNFYGSQRLGDERFKHSLERCSPEHKIRSLLMFCGGKWLEKDDELLKLTKKIKERRDQLVHAKSAALRGRDERKHAALMPEANAARQAVQECDRFLALFREADPESSETIAYFQRDWYQ